MIGSWAADIKIDEETRFGGGNASWDANLLFDSSIGLSGNFDENTTFTGGSIKLGATTVLGTLGVKAHVDQETELTGGTAFWKAQIGEGSIGLNADLEEDGDFNSSIGVEIPF
jgi:hypothetical protein